jgi:hypothetical protein
MTDPDRGGLKTYGPGSGSTTLGYGTCFCFCKRILKKLCLLQERGGCEHGSGRKGSQLFDREGRADAGGSGPLQNQLPPTVFPHTQLNFGL